MAEKKQLKPLEISCNNADCQSNLHCFRRTRELRKFPKGRCQYCGNQLVDWPRVHKRNLDDVENTFGSLKCEWIRHHFWETPLTDRIVNHARRKGRIGLGKAVQKRIRQTVGRPSSQYPYDGRQTPFSGKGETIITRGQHAIACCCRKCIEYWHGILIDDPLNDTEIMYFSDLVMMYVDVRLPQLGNEPVYVPRLK